MAHRPGAMFLLTRDWKGYVSITMMMLMKTTEDLPVVNLQHCIAALGITVPLNNQVGLYFLPVSLL